MAASGTFSRSLSLCLSISLATHSFPPTQSKCTSFFFLFLRSFPKKTAGPHRDANVFTGSTNRSWPRDGRSDRKLDSGEKEVGGGGEWVWWGRHGGRGVEMLPVSCSATPLCRSSERTAALFIDGRYGSLCRSGRKSFGRQENFLDCFSHSRKFPLAC